MTNASDGFLAGGQSLNYGPTSDTRWLGRPRGGMIVSEPREEQQTDINTRQPLFWDDARTRPKMQLVFTVVCDGSGPAGQNGWNTNERVDQADTGHRQVYVKGKDKTEAIKAQIHQHGRTGLRMGDYYYECWTGTRPGQNNIGTARTWAVMLFPSNEIQGAQGQFFGNEQQPAAPAAPSGFGAQPGQPQHVLAWSNVPTGASANPGPPPQFGQHAAPGPISNTPVQVAQQWGAQPSAPMGFGTSVQQAQSGAHPLQQHGAESWTQAQHEAYAAANHPQGFGQAPQQYAPPAAQQAPANGFGAPPVAPQPEQAPPANPWGQAPPASNPYAG